jgi:hypothetical protein
VHGLNIPEKKLVAAEPLLVPTTNWLIPELLVLEVEESAGSISLLTSLLRLMRASAAAACCPTVVEEAANTISTMAVWLPETAEISTTSPE